MLAVEPGGLHSGDEELRPLGVGSSIRHREVARGSVLHFEILVIEFAAVDALPAHSGPMSEVSTLEHEVWDHSVEFAALVVKRFARDGAGSLLSGAEGTEILSSFGD